MTAMDNQAEDDFDLTNLNWVQGAEAPMNYSLSPPSTSSKDKHVNQQKQTPTNQIAAECKRKKLYVDTYGNKRPSCSYSCLIALVLKSASSKNSGACLPLPDIYSYIEDLFPFYKNTEGWRNAVRHNLSMNPCFRKTLRDEGWEGKKGYFWEISIEYLESVNKELRQFLEAEKMSLDKLRNKLFRKWAKASRQQLKDKATPTKKLITPTKKKSVEVLRDPSDVALFSPEIQKQLIKKKTTPIKAKTDQTNEIFDTNSVPSEYAGIHSPQTDDIGAARELFNCGSTSETNSPNRLYKTTNHGEIVPFSTTPVYSIYGYPTVGYGYGIPSPLGGSPVSSSDGTTQCISPPFIPLVPIGMLPPPCIMDVNGQPKPMFAASPPCQNCGHHNTPIVPEQTYTTENLCANSKDNCGCKGKRGKKAAAVKKQKTPKHPKKLKFNEDSSNGSPPDPPKRRGRPPKKAVTSTQDLVDDSDSESEYFSALTTKRKKDCSYDDDGETPIKASDGLVRTISDMSLNNDLQVSNSHPSLATKAKPFKSVPILECISREDSSVENNGRIPALRSLLDMGDASIIGITKAMKMD